jgi:hypothetical protein
MNDPECACYEYVGDNPLCPVHGTPTPTLPQNGERILGEDEDREEEAG